MPSNEYPAPNQTAIHRFAVATAASTVLLLVAGALVTSNDAADSVPDWPLAYGKIIPPLVGGMRYEFGHRVLAGIVAVLTTVLAIWLARSESRRFVRRLGWTALGLVVAQALLGAGRVLFRHPPVIATIHATVAQLFFLATVALAFYTTPPSLGEQVALEDSGSPRVRFLTALTTLATLVQLALGAGFRHGAFGVLPHIIGAVVLLGIVAWTAGAVKSRFGHVPELRKGVMLLHATFGSQILLGIAAYWAVARAISEAQPTGIYVTLTVAHVFAGALVLASSGLLTLACFHRVRPIASFPVSARSGESRPLSSGA